MIGKIATGCRPGRNKPKQESTSSCANQPKNFNEDLQEE
jgi:hypothetical protein